jgi:DNA topoisomerase-1
MSPAEYVSITANVTAPENAKYSYTSELLSFLGWKAVTNDKKIEKEEKENKYYHYLYHSQEGRVFDYRKITSKLTLKSLKQHYTEAKLVQLLEDNGIGRPSTFSMLVDKIQEKEYVKKQDIQGTRLMCKDFELENDTITETETTREFGNEKGKLVIQPMGIVVAEFLEKHFNELLNYSYTSEMETILDKISKGEEVWYETCGKCLEQIKSLIDRLQQQPSEEQEGGVGKYEVKIDEYHSYIIGKHGPVIKCSLNPKKITFIPAKPNIDISILEKGGYKLEDIADAETKPEGKDSLGKYEGYDLVLKKGKYGLYVEWGEKSKSLKCFGNRPKENITYEDVVKILDEIPKDGDTSGGQSSANIVRNISENISIRRGKFGDYIFYNGSGEHFLNKEISKNGYRTIYSPSMSAWHQISSYRFTKKYFKARYFHYGIVNSFERINTKERIDTLKENFFYLLSLNYMMLRDLIKMPFFLKFRMFWVIIAYIQHQRLAKKNSFFLNYCKIKNFKKFDFSNLIPIKSDRPGLW